MFKISENAASNISQLKGIRVAVLGAARSGIAVASLLARAGAQVLLSDIKSVDELSLPMEKLAPLGIRVETGAHTDAVLQSDLICISPGMPLTIPVLQKAAKKQIPIVGEIEAASWFCRSPIIAITGSNGKTTTTTLSGEILRQWSPGTIVAGNIGQPFAEMVSGSTPNGPVLLEISSFQLETIESFHPRISVIMNLTANHLDRYPDFESYA
ncbi:MAG: Mur ligase family protein, partial [Calditrichia bacterium]